MGTPMIVVPERALAAYPGPSQIETPFAIPDTTQASFRDDTELPQTTSQPVQFSHSALDQPAFNRNRLKAEKLIDSKVLEQLIRVPIDAGCSRARF